MSDEGNESELQKSLQDLSARQENLMAQLGKLTEGLLSMNRTTEQRFAAIESRDDHPDRNPTMRTSQDDKADLEAMTRSDFADWLLGRMTGIVQENLAASIKPVQSQVSETQDKLRQSDMKTQARDLQSSGAKDLAYWRTELAEKMHAVPNLSLAEAYQLVRLADPKKTQQLEKELGMVNEVEQEGQEVAPPTQSGEATKTGFGGLAPASGTTEDSAEMDMQTAMNAAWEETAKQFDDILSFHEQQ